MNALEAFSQHVNKSQLRKLAAEFAEGRMPAGEYRTRRRELIDAIVAGNTTIERDAPSPSPAAPPPVQAAAVRRSLPWPLLLGGASVLLVALLVWLLWPAPPEPEPPAAPVVIAPEVPRSRTLVESFVALRDFSDSAIVQFERQWMALDQAERDAARSQLWFRSLVGALRDEVKTQKALAGLSDDDAPMQRAQRVVAFAQRLGVAEQLPALGDAGARSAAPPAPATEAAAPDPASATGASVPDPASATDPEQAPDAVARRAEAPDAAAPAAPARPDPAPAQPTGRQWLAARADDELTLQIFAVNALDRVEQLMSRHPDLALHILATDGGSPRYRVFHGVFDDTDAARAAFAALPEDVAAAAGEAIVKSIAVVRDDLQGRAPRPAATGNATVVAPGGDYTLQLFASASRSNAETLVDAFPALGLELREVAGDAAPYRVVYGRFDSARAASAASLPAELLSRIGKPLAKPVDETGVSVR